MKDNTIIYKYDGHYLSATQIAERYGGRGTNVSAACRLNNPYRKRPISYYGIYRLLYIATDKDGNTMQGYRNDLAEKLGYCGQNIRDAYVNKRDVAGYKIDVREIIDFDDLSWYNN